MLSNYWLRHGKPVTLIQKQNVAGQPHADYPPAKTAYIVLVVAPNIICAASSSIAASFDLDSANGPG